MLEERCKIFLYKSTIKAELAATGVGGWGLGGCRITGRAPPKPRSSEMPEAEALRCSWARQQRASLWKPFLSKPVNQSHK